MWYKRDISSQHFKLWIDNARNYNFCSKPNKSLFQQMFADLNMLHSFPFSSSYFSGLLNTIWNKSSLWLLLYGAGIGWNPIFFFSSFTKLKANYPQQSIGTIIQHITQRTVFMVWFIFNSFSNLSSEDVCFLRYVPSFVPAWAILRRKWQMSRIMRMLHS